MKPCTTVRSPRIFSPALGFAALLLVGMAPGAARAQSPDDRSLISHPAPAFTRTDLQHHTIAPAAFRGKVVLLNFWATWCGPCKLEIPKFIEWQKTYGPRGFQVLGASMDDGSPEVVSAVAKLHIPYPVFMGDGKLGNLYGGVEGLPVTFLIDRHGTVYGRYGSTDLAKLQVDINHLLAQR